MNANRSEHSHDNMGGRHTPGFTAGDPAHDQWDELAVGYALTSLEPDELDRFFEHLLQSCDLCRQSVDDTAAIGAQLGSATIRPVEHVSADLRQRVLQAALESRPAIPQSPAGLPTPTDLPSSLRRDAVAGRAPVVDLAERRARRFGFTGAGDRTGWLVAAAAAVVALVLSVTTVAALRGQSQQRSVADARQSAISAIVGGGGGSASVIPLRDDSGNNNATVVARADSIAVIAQNLKANSASTSYVLWGIATGSNSSPVALGVFDVHGGKLQTTQVGTDSRGKYTGFATYAISHEAGHTPPVRPGKIVALGNA